MRSNTLTETIIIFRRAMRLSLRNPVWVIIGLFQPLLYLALFGPLLQRLTRIPGFPHGSSWRVFVPGAARAARDLRRRVRRLRLDRGDALRRDRADARHPGFTRVAARRPRAARRRRAARPGHRARARGARVRPAGPDRRPRARDRARRRARCRLRLGVIRRRPAAQDRGLDGLGAQQHHGSAAVALRRVAADVARAGLVAHGLGRQPRQARRRRRPLGVPRPRRRLRPSRGGSVATVGMVLAGMAFGTRTFKRQSS